MSVGGVELVGIAPVLLGFGAGVVLLDRGDARVPQVRTVITGRREVDTNEQRARVGPAVPFTVATTLHDGPEGLAVPVAARSAGLGPLFYATVAGGRAELVEIPLEAFGAVAVSVAAPLLPYAMGFAAGGMSFVVSHGIVPRPTPGAANTWAPVGPSLGAVVMVCLEVALA